MSVIDRIRSLKLTLSDLAALSAITENQGKPLPAYRIAYLIPSPDPTRRGITVRQARNIVSKLLDRGLITKFKQQSYSGKDRANIYTITSPLTHREFKPDNSKTPKGSNNKILSSKYPYSLYELRGEMNGDCSELDRYHLYLLADKVCQKTGADILRVLRMLLWLVKNMGVTMRQAVEMGREILKERQPHRDALKKRIKDRGAYFITCLETSLNSAPIGGLL